MHQADSLLLPNSYLITFFGKDMDAKKYEQFIALRLRTPRFSKKTHV
jgi:hypothetical protein